MKKTAIIDYKAGNLDSVSRAVEECGGEPFITDNPEELERANYIILPGVGVFAVGMRILRGMGFEEALNEQVIRNGIPFLGICLGMQLLAKNGCEGGETEGLGWIDAEVIRFEPRSKEERLPHIGWNEVSFVKESLLFEGIESGKDFYFIHSYHMTCRNEEEVIARTPYCGGFVSSVGKKHIFGTQFHPEKSQRLGFKVLENFLSL
jgi:imidazole glycerol-phosphate synthase subunit HisH